MKFHGRFDEKFHERFDEHLTSRILQDKRPIEEQNTIDAEDESWNPDSDFDGQQRHSEINGRLLRKLASDPIQSTWRSVWRNIANGIPSSLILSRDDAAFVVCRWFRGIILSPLPFPQVLFSSSLSESVSCFDDN